MEVSLGEAFEVCDEGSLVYTDERIPDFLVSMAVKDLPILQRLIPTMGFESGCHPPWRHWVSHGRSKIAAVKVLLAEMEKSATGKLVALEGWWLKQSAGTFKGKPCVIIDTTAYFQE